MDAKGQSVACAVTMNGPFGSGHTALGTGVTLARAPASGDMGLASAFLTPVIASSNSEGPAELAGAGAGGPNGRQPSPMHWRGSRAANSSRRDLHSTGAAPYDTVNAIICSGGQCSALPIRRQTG